MLAYKPTKTAEDLSYPVLDWERLTRASHILTGSQAPLSPSTPKEVLLSLAAIWKAADLNQKTSKDDLTKKACKFVKSLETLQKNHFRSLQLPFRIRGTNQLRALTTNGFNPSTQEIRIGLNLLQKSIQKAEKTGALIVEIPCDNAALERQLSALPFSNASEFSRSPALIFQDELLQRPETKRIWAGDYSHMANFKAKKLNSSPEEQLLNLGDKFTGNKVTLAKNLKVEKVTIVPQSYLRGTINISSASCAALSTSIREQKADKTSLEYAAHVPEFVSPNGTITPAAPINVAQVSLSFPKIQAKIKENAADDTLPGEGAISDGYLRLYASQNYGCNGRQFVKALPNICEALTKELSSAALKWEGETALKAEKLQTVLSWLEANSEKLNPSNPRDLQALPPAHTLIRLLETPTAKKTRIEQFHYDTLFTNKKTLALPVEEDQEPIFTSLTAELTKSNPSLLAELLTLRAYSKANPLQIKNFLREYTLVALTHTQSPKSKLDLGKNDTISEATEILGSANNSLLAPYTHALIPDSEKPSNKEKFKPKKTLIDASGPEWRNALILKEIEKELVQNPTRDAILETAQIENVAEKKRWVCENIYNSAFDVQEPILTLRTPSFTPHLEADFEIQKEERNQEEFESKSERLLGTSEEEGGTSYADEFNLEKWVVDNTMTQLTLPNDSYLIHRMTQYGGVLKAPLTNAEKYDPEVSLSTIRLSAPTKKSEQIKTPSEKTILELSDFFDSETGTLPPDFLKGKAYRESDPKIRKGLENLEKFGAMVKTWQLPHATYSPIEQAAQQWISDLKTNTTNADLKIKSLDELDDLTCKLILSTGFGPNNMEKTPDWMERPSISSTLPLQLLCGVPQKSLLTDLHTDSTKLWDTVVRWTNAAAGFQSPIEYNEEKQLITLFKTDERDLINHAIRLELLNKPDFLTDYLQKNNIDLKNLPEEIKPFKDILLPVKNCPNTLPLFGEETPLLEILTHLEHKGVKLPSPNATHIESAPLNALTQFLNNLRASIDQITTPDYPPNQKAQVVISTNLTNNEKELQEILGDDFNQKNLNSTAILERLLTHNPNSLEISTESEVYHFKKGSGTTWAPTPQNTDSRNIDSIWDLLNETSALLTKPLSPEIAALSKKCAAHNRINNLPQLVSNLTALPPQIQELEKELLAPILLTAKQVIAAQKNAQNALQKLADWTAIELPSEDGQWKDKSHTSQILDSLQAQKDLEGAKHAVYQIVGAFESKATTPPTLQIGTPSFYAESLLEKGRVTTSLSITADIQSSLKKLEEVAGAELTSHLDDLTDKLNQIIRFGESAPCQTFFKSHSPCLQIIRDRTSLAHYTPHIQTLAKTWISENNTRDKSDRINDWDPKLFPNHDPKLKVKQEPNALLVNRLWAKSWFEAPSTLERIQSRVRLGTWIKTNNNQDNSLDQIRTNAAFLEFCELTSRSYVTQAIVTSSLTEKQATDLQEASNHFAADLTEMGVSHSANLPTKLHAALALHYTSKRKYTDYRQKDQWVTKLLGHDSLPSTQTPHSSKPEPHPTALLTVSLAELDSASAVQSPYSASTPKFQESSDVILAGAQKAAGLIISKPIEFKKKKTLNKSPNLH